MLRLWLQNDIFSAILDGFGRGELSYQNACRPAGRVFVAVSQDDALAGVLALMWDLSSSAAAE